MENDLLKKVHEMMFSADKEMNNLGLEIFMNSNIKTEDIDYLNSLSGYELNKYKYEYDIKDILNNSDNITDIL